MKVVNREKVTYLNVTGVVNDVTYEFPTGVFPVIEEGQTYLMMSTLLPNAAWGTLPAGLGKGDIMIRYSGNWERYIPPSSRVVGEKIYNLNNGTPYTYRGGTTWSPDLEDSVYLLEVIQDAHGFASGNVVYYDSANTKWALAQADDDATLAVGVVEVIDTVRFNLVFAGEYELTGHGFTEFNKPYYLSTTVAGGVTTTRPSGPGVFVQQIFIPKNDSKLVISFGMVLGGEDLGAGGLDANKVLTERGEISDIDEITKTGAYDGVDIVGAANDTGDIDIWAIKNSVNTINYLAIEPNGTVTFGQRIDGDLDVTWFDAATGGGGGSTVHTISSTTALKAVGGATVSEKITNSILPDEPNIGTLYIVQYDDTPNADNEYEGFWRCDAVTPAINWVQIINHSNAKLEEFDVDIAARVQGALLKWQEPVLPAEGEWRAERGVRINIVEASAIANLEEPGIETTEDILNNFFDTLFPTLDAEIEGDIVIVNKTTGYNDKFPGSYIFTPSNWFGLGELPDPRFIYGAVKTLASDPDIDLSAIHMKEGSIQATLEGAKKELKIVNETNHWINLFSEEEIKQWITDGSSFQGTVTETTFTNLPAIGAGNRGHYWTWEGTEGYIILATDANVGTDLVGEVMEKGDWVQSNGTNWLHISSNFLTYDRWKAIGTFQPWVAGIKELDTLVSYRTSATDPHRYYRAVTAILATTPAPAPGDTTPWLDITPELRPEELFNIDPGLAVPANNTVMQYDGAKSSWEITPHHNIIEDWDNAITYTKLHELVLIGVKLYKCINVTGNLNQSPSAAGSLFWVNVAPGGTSVWADITANITISRISSPSGSMFNLPLATTSFTVILPTSADVEAGEWWMFHAESSDLAKVTFNNSEGGTVAETDNAEAMYYFYWDDATSKWKVIKQAGALFGYINTTVVDVDINNATGSSVYVNRVNNTGVLNLHLPTTNLVDNYNLDIIISPAAIDANPHTLTFKHPRITLPPAAATVSELVEQDLGLLHYFAVYKGTPAAGTWTLVRLNTPADGYTFFTTATPASNVEIPIRIAEWDSIPNAVIDYSIVQASWQVTGKIGKNENPTIDSIGSSYAGSWGSPNLLGTGMIKDVAGKDSLAVLSPVARTDIKVSIRVRNMDTGEIVAVKKITPAIYGADTFDLLMLLSAYSAKAHRTSYHTRANIGDNFAYVPIDFYSATPHKYPEEFKDNGVLNLAKPWGVPWGYINQAWTHANLTGPLYGLNSAGALTAHFIKGRRYKIVYSINFNKGDGGDDPDIKFKIHIGGVLKDAITIHYMTSWLTHRPAPIYMYEHTAASADLEVHMSADNFPHNIRFQNGHILVEDAGPITKY